MAPNLAPLGIEAGLTHGRHPRRPQSSGEMLSLTSVPGSITLGQRTTRCEHPAVVAVLAVVLDPAVGIGAETGPVPGLPLAPGAKGRDGLRPNNLVQCLEIAQGDVSQAARMATRDRTDLCGPLSRHGTEPDTFKD